MVELLRLGIIKVISFSLESAEICDGDLQENIPLAYRYFPYLKGRLHLKRIERILIDNNL